jgi:recombinational DNA repair ATPase RecF
MILDSIKYSQFKGEPGEWNLAEAKLGKINLIVGKNASGKSRTINIMSSLSNLLSGKIKPSFKSSNFTAVFKNDDKSIKYNLFISNGKVTKEELSSDGKILLKRGVTGKGKIYTLPMKKEMEFQTPPTELASNFRRDSVQHPFFEVLYKWSTSINVYKFGTPLGQDTMIIWSEEQKNNQNINISELEGTHKIFKEGNSKYGSKFIKAILKDMTEVGYSIDSIELDKPDNVESRLGLLCLTLKEKDVDVRINQTDLSQGMFRALSLIIQINYYNLLNKSSCIMIDDIGEGLDYERSTNLINLLISKAESSEVQLIMSTNDRFVMNNVPLKYWSIIQRGKNSSRIFNYQNSKKTFEEFEFTGLNNFDFFSKKFFEKGF